MPGIDGRRLTTSKSAPSKLPVEYDDKGFPKKYTDAELKERTGPDPSQPGYASSFEELEPG